MLRAGDVPEYSQRDDTGMSAAIGMSTTELMLSSYAIRWDKRDEYEPSPDDDCDWIGEDAGGVWLRRHPIVALSMHPRLVGIVADWHAGVHDLTRADLRRMSAVEIDGACVMIAAKARGELRASRQGRENE